MAGGRYTLVYIGGSHLLADVNVFGPSATGTLPGMLLGKWQQATDFLNATFHIALAYH